MTDTVTDNLEDIKLSAAANATIVQMCKYKCFPEHLPKTPVQVDMAHIELQKTGLINTSGLATEKAHKYIKHTIALADAFARHG